MSVVVFGLDVGNDGFGFGMVVVVMYGYVKFVGG